MPSPNSKPARSADAILASYLERQERQLDSSKRTNSKAPYKLAAAHDHGRQLDCRNLAAGSLGRQHARSFFPHLDESHGASEAAAVSSSILQVQRKFLAFFYIYVLIIVSLYLTYAVYCYYQQNQFKQQQRDLHTAALSSGGAGSGSGNQAPTAPLVESDAQQQQQQQRQDQLIQDLQNKLEGKVHLLERYIEVLAADLESTKARLSEREKCACSIGCSFNGTKYADGQKWAQKCDTCRCQAGKISCQPRECPKLSCQSDPAAVIQLVAGQCCPSCMKKCKVNKMLVRHGHSFKPLDSKGQQTKQCKCLDGLIKCEPLQAPASPGQGLEPASPGANKTIEYLRSILGPKFAALDANRGQLERAPS